MNSAEKVEKAGAEVLKLLSECGSGIPYEKELAKLQKAIDVSKEGFNRRDWKHALTLIFGLESVRLSVKELHKLSRLFLKSRLFLLIDDLDFLNEQVPEWE
jgi:hypothetical protein